MRLGPLSASHHEPSHPARSAAAVWRLDRLRIQAGASNQPRGHGVGVTDPAGTKLVKTPNNISPAPSSSRPQTGVGTDGTRSISRAAEPLIAAQPPGAPDGLRGVRENAVAPAADLNSGRAGTAPPGGGQPGRWRRRDAEFRCCPAQASSRSRNVRPVPAPRARSGTDTRGPAQILSGGDPGRPGIDQRGPHRFSMRSRACSRSVLGCSSSLVVIRAKVPTERTDHIGAIRRR